jgi:hypothetical protein
MLNEIRMRISILGKLESETELVQSEHYKEESKNRSLRTQFENYKVPDVNSYVNIQEHSYELKKELKVWERKVEIAEVSERELQLN